MSQPRNLRNSLNKTRFFSDDSMGTKGSRAQKRATLNQYEECPECGSRFKAKNLVRHIAYEHSDAEDWQK